MTEPFDWLARARTQAEAAPLRPRVPLELEPGAGDTACRIGSIEPSVAERLRRAGLSLQRAGDGYRIAAPAAAALPAIARFLHAEGIASHWRDEQLAVVDSQGRVVGEIERGVVRVLGLQTEAVHLVGRDEFGAQWVQLRASTKSTDPGLWDTLMGGQVAAGESIPETLARETMEEAGLEVAALQGLQRASSLWLRRPVREGYMVERITVFRAVVPAGVVPVNRDGEVDRFECLDRSALVRRLAGGEFTLEATLILGAELERHAESSAGGT